MGKSLEYVYRCSTPKLCRKYFDLSQRCPIAEQYDGVLRFCEYCILVLRDVCNFASCPHSNWRLNHEAYMQRIYTPPNQMPDKKGPFKSMR